MRHWISYEENLRGVYTLDDLRGMFELLESELGFDAVAEQMEPEVVTSELDVVREILGHDQNIAVTQKRPGCCIWVSGDTKPHRETLKEFGFRWAPKKSAWYWKPQAA